MKNYYESHITMQGEAKSIQREVERHGWKFSCIDGDPVLGKGVKCYATMLYSILKGDEFVLEHLHIVANTLKSLGIMVLRRKVELVIYDDRDASAVCDGGCCEANAGTKFVPDDGLGYHDPGNEAGDFDFGVGNDA